MAEILPTDQFLVNRSDSTSTVIAEKLMATILDDDLMLINRADVTFRVTGADVKESLGGKPVFPEADEITSSPAFQGGTGTEVDPFLLQTVDARPGGAIAASVEQIYITVAGATEGDLVVWTDNSTGAGTRFAQPTGIVAVNGTWTGRLIYQDSPATTADTDYTGSLQIGNVYFRWVVEQGIDPIRPIDPSPDEITANPDFQSGSGTAGDPYILETQTCAPAGSNVSSAEEITIAEPGATAGELVRWYCSNPRFEQPEGVTDSSGVWTGRLVYNDTPDTTIDETYVGNLYIGTTYFRWSVNQRVLATQAPEVSTVSLVENNPVEGDRFTSQSFVVQGTMSVDGIPASTKTIAAHVDGSLTVPTETDPIQSVGELSVIYSAACTQTGGATNFPAAFDGVFQTKAVMPLGSTIVWDCESFNLPAAVYYLQMTALNGQGLNVQVSIACEFRDIPDVSYTLNTTTNGAILAYFTGDAYITGNDWNRAASPTKVTVTYLAGPSGAGDFGWQYTIQDVTVLEDSIVPQLIFTGNKDLDVLEAGDTVTTPIVQFDEPLESSSIDSSGAWTAGSAPEANDWYGVTYGNNKFVAVAYSGPNPAMYSYDGITWVVTPTPVSNFWAVTYGDNKFVAVGNSTGMSSPDGITWTTISVPAGATWNAITYGKDKFVAVAAGYTMYSLDGINWTTAIAAPENNTWFDVTYGNDKFVAVSYDGTNRVMHSPDGITWTLASAAEASNWYCSSCKQGQQPCDVFG